MSSGMTPQSRQAYASVTLEAALLGDGTLTEDGARRIFVGSNAPERDPEKEQES